MCGHKLIKLLGKHFQFIRPNQLNKYTDRKNKNNMSTADKTRAPKIDTLKLMAYLATKNGADIAPSEPRPKLASAERLLEITTNKERNAKMKES